ncbi:uncharacterized protein EI90DRAFT_853365 [Cantharellus anzutake]|uniref:uncharacterized protein n=1 Tax=Cantharellus anzutake TaxID=1750568 RepID=UPI0019033232|nr:uncharacterized protein EI90DRAFT_853365 [Cantharellus anzutake]KAF8332374.1 hypothetical protein EI90DRAFT_853365 [Cantharellus anzutake]
MEPPAPKVDPTHGRCLITRQHGRSVQRCHIIRQSEPSDAIFRLELWWGMSFRSLDLSSTKNTILLRADLHWLFECGRFGLLPSKDIIDKVSDHVKSIRGRRCVSPILDIYSGAEVFDYILVPFQEMKHVAIPRLRLAQGTTPILSKNDVSGVDCYTYPFRDLGPLRSHILPHFAIYDLGSKILRIDSSEFYRTGYDLSQIRHIFREWVCDLEESLVGGKREVEPVSNKRKRRRAP